MTSDEAVPIFTSGMDNFFKTVWGSCTSFAFYRKVTGLSFLQCLKYIVPFCLIIGALLYINPSLELLKISRQLREWTDKSLPEIRIEDGIISIDAPQPCYLEPAGILVPAGGEGRTRNLKLAFDTTGEIEALDETDDADVLFLRDTLIVRGPAGDATEVPLKEIWLFSKYKEITISRENVNKYLPGITWLLVILPFVITVVAKPIQAVAYSLIGMIAATREGKRFISFKGVYNISLFATIPATIVSAGVQLLRIDFNPLYLMIFYSFVAIVFVIGAITNMRQPA